MSCGFFSFVSYNHKAVGIFSFIARFAIECWLDAELISMAFKAIYHCDTHMLL